MDEESFEKYMESLIEQHHLPASFNQVVQSLYYPLARKIASIQKLKQAPLLLAVSGAQGTGKSTMALFLKTILEQKQHCTAVVCSIDDLYLTKSQRLALAEEVHPLFATRGVPGTHDLVLGNHLFDQLLSANDDSVTPVPVFDKGSDDRAPKDDWPLFTGAPDVIILEGWCVCATAQSPEELVEPCNSLEELEDPDGTWRNFVQQQLAGPYASFFNRFDYVVMLKAPSMACVADWRGEQETKLKLKLEQSGGDASAVMDTDQLNRFIMHYERLTTHMLSTLPKQADVVIYLTEDHQVDHFEWKNTTITH
eukprot:TRINITY_DN11666_c0_g1_i1.p1 TRINITY_DN11666_c0_g1~~TRINITY_DN11666_c0_g1_i1.p1  ORF type:complete len:309 (-),score=80.81 TRINITY_DN11666_c0_g1_i1:72-998(-)